MTPDAFAEHYLRHTGLHAIVALVSVDDTRSRIVAARSTQLRPPQGIVVASAWWCRDEALARRLAEACYEIADATGTPRRRNWIACHGADAGALITVAAARLRVPLWTDKLLRKRALAVVEEVEADMERRRRRGDLKSVNREYSAQRAEAALKGERVPTYGDYMLGLKRRTLAEHAVRNVGVLLVEERPSGERVRTEVAKYDGRENV